MGLGLRRRGLQYSWRGGRLQPASMAAFNRHQWQPSTGIGGRFRPASVAIFARNTHLPPWRRHALSFRRSRRCQGASPPKLPSHSNRGCPLEGADDFGPRICSRSA